MVNWVDRQTFNYSTPQKGLILVCPHLITPIINQLNKQKDKGFTDQGRIQDFKLGGVLKKIAPSGGRREHVWGISCEKSRFQAKKSYFFQFQGRRAPGATPSLDPPLLTIKLYSLFQIYRCQICMFLCIQKIYFHCVFSFNI